MQDMQEDEGKDPQDALAPSLLAQIRDMAAAM